MHDEPESTQGRWMMYFTLTLLALPVLYALSSGPAQYVARTETGRITLSFVSGPNAPMEYIPFCQRAVDSRWTPALATIYLPLTRLEQHAIAAIPLNWYWRLFGEHRKNIFPDDPGGVGGEGP